MTTEKTPTAPAASAEQLAALLTAMKGSDSVELKLTVPTDEHRATIAGLPIDPVEAQPRQVFFFDTPDLALDKAGVVVRARRIQGGIGDVMVEDAQRLAERARSHGVETRLELYPVATHDFHVFWSFLPEAADAVQQAGSFARDARSLTTGDRQVSGH